MIFGGPKNKGKDLVLWAVRGRRENGDWSPNQEGSITGSIKKGPLKTSCCLSSSLRSRSKGRESDSDCFGVQRKVEKAGVTGGKYGKKLQGE